MKYTFEMSSGAMIYIPSLINIGSDIQKLIGRQTHRQHHDRISLLFFFKIRIVNLKTTEDMFLCLS
jgi:hypothetical protein